MAIVEAAAVGLLVVSTSVGGVPEVRGRRERRGGGGVLGGRVGTQGVSVIMWCVLRARKGGIHAPGDELAINLPPSYSILSYIPNT